jgi:Ecdysteroid kinase-like family
MEPSGLLATRSSEPPDDDNDALPVWVDEKHIDPDWIARKTSLPCVDCLVEDRSNANRTRDRLCDCATLLLTLTLRGEGTDEKLEDDDESPEVATQTVTLILKQVPAVSRSFSLRLGLAREGIAYDQLGLEASCPKVHYAYGNMRTGDKVVILEHLHGAIDSAAFFGPASPHNWKKDLAAMTSQAPGVSAVDVTRMTFVAIAKIHAQHWRNLELLRDDKTWLRGQEWLQGKNRESWETSQGLCKTSWETSDLNLIVWDANLRACMEKVIGGISWEAQQQRLHRDGPWTLVHGDFWPGNIMYLIKEKEIRLLDWEMCGLGSGPQDLGQYIISNMQGATRRDHDKALVEAYHEELLRCGVQVSWEYVWREYQVGGAERWMWFLGTLWAKASLKSGISSSTTKLRASWPTTG